MLLFEHDLFGKPVSTFPDQALVVGPPRSKTPFPASGRSGTRPINNYRTGQAAVEALIMAAEGKGPLLGDQLSHGDRDRGAVNARPASPSWSHSTTAEDHVARKAASVGHICTGIQVCNFLRAIYDSSASKERQRLGEPKCGRWRCAETGPADALKDDAYLVCHF